MVVHRVHYIKSYVQEDLVNNEEKNKMLRNIVILGVLLLLSACSTVHYAKSNSRSDLAGHSVIYKVEYDTVCGNGKFLKKGQMFGAVSLKGTSMAQDRVFLGYSRKPLPEHAVGLSIIMLLNFGVNSEYFAVITPEGNFVMQNHHIVYRVNGGDFTTQGAVACVLKDNKPLFKQL